MIDTIYGWIPLGLLVVVVLLRRPHGPAGWGVLVILALWYVWTICLQEIMGSNSPAEGTLFLAGILSIFAVMVSLKTQRIWPLAIAALLSFKVVLDVCYLAVGMPNRLYQDAGAILFYACILITLFRPVGGQKHDKKSWFGIGKLGGNRFNSNRQSTGANE